LTLSDVLYFLTDYAIASIHNDLKRLTKNGKQYLYISKTATNLIINDLKVNFENVDSDQLREIIANFVGNNRKKIISTFTPALEQATSKLIITTINIVFKRFSHDEIFPEHKLT